MPTKQGAGLFTAKFTTKYGLSPLQQTKVASRRWTVLLLMGEFNTAMAEPHCPRVNHRTIDLPF